AVINAGAIRSDKIFPAGTTITRREVLTALPFGNRLVTIDLAGSALRTAIENRLSQLPAPSGRFPQVAGLKTRLIPAAPLTAACYRSRSAIDRSRDGALD